MRYGLTDDDGATIHGIFEAETNGSLLIPDGEFTEVELDVWEEDEYGNMVNTGRAMQKRWFRNAFPDNDIVVSTAEEARQHHMYPIDDSLPKPEDDENTYHEEEFQMVNGTLKRQWKAKPKKAKHRRADARENVKQMNGWLKAEAQNPQQSEDFRKLADVVQKMVEDLYGE